MSITAADNVNVDLAFDYNYTYKLEQKWLAEQIAGAKAIPPILHQSESGSGLLNRTPSQSTD